MFARAFTSGLAACVDKRIDLHAPALKREPDGRVLFRELMATARAGRELDALATGCRLASARAEAGRPVAMSLGGSSSGVAPAKKIRS